MYGIFTNIYHKNQPNVGKYTSPMDGMGLIKQSHKHTSNTYITSLGVLKLPHGGASFVTMAPWNWTNP